MMSRDHATDEDRNTQQSSRPLWLWMGLGLAGIALLAAAIITYGWFQEPRKGSKKQSSADGMLQLYVPEGQFTMGTQTTGSLPDEGPQHAVYLDAYWIDRTEVTNAMFNDFVEETGHVTTAEKEGHSWVFTGNGWRRAEDISWRQPRTSQAEIPAFRERPVVHVSWQDAQAYCQWAGRRLPTEAEWEKAARGSDGLLYPWGEERVTDTPANFADKNLPAGWSNREADDGYTLSAPVGSFPAGRSPYGALDMAGNVYEWIQDWYAWNYYARSPYRNPQGPSSGEHRVLRGGSWATKGANYQTTTRVSLPPTYTLQDTGFRCVEPVAP